MSRREVHRDKLAHRQLGRDRNRNLQAPLPCDCSCHSGNGVAHPGERCLCKRTRAAANPA